MPFSLQRPFHTTDLYRADSRQPTCPREAPFRPTKVFWYRPNRSEPPGDWKCSTCSITSCLDGLWNACHRTWQPRLIRDRPASLFTIITTGKSTILISTWIQIRKEVPLWLLVLFPIQRGMRCDAARPLWLSLGTINSGGKGTVRWHFERLCFFIVFNYLSIFLFFKRIGCMIQYTLL